MSLIRLDIANFRNLNETTLNCTPRGCHFFFGPNGSGKTSILEAIYYLSRGKSFRVSLANRMIHHDSDKFALFAEMHAKDDHSPVPIGLERSRSGDSRIKISGQENASLADLAYLTPTLLINSGSYSLLDAGPQVRRTFLDWGMFYVREDFLRLWKNYARVLKQRNAALRARATYQEIQTWNNELIQYALPLDALRKEFVQQLLPIVISNVTTLLALPDLDLYYLPGWDEERSLDEVLRHSLESDLRLGYTQFGPHRADLKVTLERVPVRDVLSRGQQKLFVCGMILAQGAMLREHANREPIYLIDDLPSELDTVNRSLFLALLTQQKSQVFLTALEQEAVGELQHETIHMFHVEHGKITGI